jgi:creatinine amidohydrolase
MQDIVEYQDLLPYQFKARMERCALAYVPVGSLEWHGEHMALGNDAIKMHALCCEAARLGGGIVFPPIFYGIPYMVAYGRQYEYDANLPVTEAFLKNLLVTTLHGLESVGFRAAILATGHTCREQCDLMREIADEYDGSMRVYGTDDMEWADDLDFHSDHAAKWETSILWYLRPALVDIYKLPKDTEAPLEGIGGDDPRIYASRDLGRAAVRAIARDLSQLGARLLAEG